MKFEIQNLQTPQPKKKFEIQKIQENQKKKFEVTSKWFKQTNLNDCGPCLLLNSLENLNLDILEKNVAEVRAEINTLRSAENQDALRGDRWIFSSDIAKFLRKYNFEVKEFPLCADDRIETLENIQRELDSILI